MDAITLLKNDHRTVEQLFKRFEKAGDRAHVQKRQIVDRIIEELSVHAAIEEQVFYPVARAAVPDAEQITLESLEEHHVVKWVLSELEDMDPAHERFDAKVTVLIESVRHHVDEEENEFFPKVRKQLSSKDLAELGDTLADAKQSAPTRPHPRMPDTNPANLITGAIAGVADQVGSNLSGIAQGSVSAVQDLIARLTGADRPKVSPTGSSSTRKRATDVRSAASTATDSARDTARNAKSSVTSTAKAATSGAKSTAKAATSGAKSTAKAAKSGAKGTATSAKKSARATATTAKRASTTTGRTARGATKKTAATAKRAASKTAAAASSSR
jgi:hemerythrin-like domain-containing protein